MSHLVSSRRISLLLQSALLFILGVAGLWSYYSFEHIPAANASSNIIIQAPPCTPDTAYLAPANLSLSKPGLQQLIDSPSSYAVYGNTSAQIMSQITNCTPVHSTSGHSGLYAATTSYAINWQFDYTDNGSGSCVIEDVRVGLHVNQVFPAWQTDGTSPGLNKRWQTYITKLQTYEAGHVQLDQTAANAVLRDLQNFPPTDCNTIADAAAAQANADVRTYDVANANYDTDNNYGLKQTVIL